MKTIEKEKEDQSTDKTGKVTNTSELEQSNPHIFRKMNLKKLENQVIVITGASSGIGLVTARMAASKGAKVVVAARNEDALKKLVEEFRDQGYSAIYVKADVGREEDISRMFDTNFWSVVYGTKAAVKHFKDRGVPGALINVGSIFGDRGTVIQSTYAAAKFAVHGWTESVRMELKREKAPVSVTLIHPGRIDTPYNEHARSYLDKQPTHRGMIYPPEAVAEAILYSAENPKRDRLLINLRR